MRRPALVTVLLLNSVPAITAIGSAHVVNKCGTQVYFASVAQGVHAEMKPLPAGGYSEPYNKANVGVSIKLSPSLNGPVAQFEFTWAKPNINYDISNIDGNPFAQQGVSLVPSRAGAVGFPTCVTIDCPAGQDKCEAAYNLPDDVRTKVCPEDSDLTFVLCPGGAPAVAAVSLAPKGSSTTPVVNAPSNTNQGKQSSVTGSARGGTDATPATRAGNLAQSKPFTASNSRVASNRQHIRRGHVHQFE